MKCKNILYLGLDPTRFEHQGNLTHLPLIQTVARPFEGKIRAAFENLSLYSHVLFTSRTAVNLYLEYTYKMGKSQDLKDKIYLSIGKATTACLQKGQLDAHTAKTETGEGVIELLHTLTPHMHLFFPRSAQGRDLIFHYLKEKQIPFTSVDLYDTLPNRATLPDLEAFDTIVFTSPSTVDAFFSLTQNLPPLEKCVAIGPITQVALRNLAAKIKQNG